MLQQTEPSFLAVDFFCGAGGTTRGLLDAGGYVVAGVDRDSQCEATFVSNNKNSKLDRRPPYFLKRDIFPCSEQYPEGQQTRLLERGRGPAHPLSSDGTAHPDRLRDLRPLPAVYLPGKKGAVR